MYFPYASEKAAIDIMHMLSWSRNAGISMKWTVHRTAHQRIVERERKRIHVGSRVLILFRPGSFAAPFIALVFKHNSITL